MKNRTYLLVKIGSIVCLALIMLLSFPMFEQEHAALMAKDKGQGKAKGKEKKEQESEKDAKKEARENYSKAQEAIKKGKLNDALKFLKIAIAKDPHPATQYDPYLQLGFVYIALGDLKSAQSYCTQSKTFGVTSKTNINECFELIVTATQKAPTAKPQPTVPPVPTPTPPSAKPPTPQPQAPASRPDSPPTIEITSEIPERTVEETLTITGVATDDQGIVDINVSVRKPGTKAITSAPRLKLVQKNFEVTVPLEIGQNEIVIQAQDTGGQVGEHVMTIVRNRPVRAEPAESRSAESPEPAATPETTPEAKPERGKVYAVIIGIGTFQDERIPPLRFTANDAQGFYDVLTDPNYGGVPKDQVQLLIDKDATDRNIKTAIGKWLSQQARAEDTVIIYYSGHGAPEGEEKYWVTYNADIDNLYTTALSNNEIYDMLNRIESKRVITLLDSCYSAATVNRKDRTRALQAEVPWEKFGGEGRVTLSASDGKQLSLEIEAYQHGAFTYYVLEALKGRADGAAGTARDGMVEVEELWNYVKNSVTDAAKKRGNKQTPVFQGTLTSGIPLTYDLTYLEELERKRVQEKQEKQAKLKDLFEQKKIRADHFDCAFKMIDEGKSDGYLDGLLSAGISPETFSRLFTCGARSE